MDLGENYWEEDDEDDRKFLDRAQKGQLDFNIVGKATVIDGDTITINKYKIRFSGIDAPEKNYRGQTQFAKDQKACGLAAKKLLLNSKN